jgi:hypothetical protein
MIRYWKLKNEEVLHKVEDLKKDKATSDLNLKNLKWDIYLAYLGYLREEAARLRELGWHLKREHPKEKLDYLRDLI